MFAKFSTHGTLGLSSLLLCALPLASCGSSSGGNDSSPPSASTGGASAAGGQATAGSGGSTSAGNGGSEAAGNGGSSLAGAGGNTAGAGGSGGSATRAVKKTSCTYDIVTRPEYTDVYDPASAGSLAGEVVSAAPTIQHLRLGLGGTLDPAAADKPNPSTSIAVGWETDVMTTATSMAWGASPDPTTWDAGNFVDGISYTVPLQAHSVDGMALRIHEAHVCGLTPNTTYYYRVGGGPAGSEVWSDVRTFRTLTASPDDEVVVALTGDSRDEVGNAWQILEERLWKRGDVQLTLFSGDMADLSSSGTEYASWLSHGEIGIENTPTSFGQILTLFAMGNHENYQSNYYSSVIQPVDTKNYAGFGELFFSVDVGAAHIIVTDDLAIGTPTLMPALATAELAFLTKDLTAAQANRAAVPWIIVVHHHGEWTSSAHATDPVDLAARAKLVPLWDQFNVDLVVNGHDHDYERSMPLTMNGDGTPKTGSGTTYLVCAGSGADGYSAGSSAHTATSFSYSSDSALGSYGILHVTKAKLSLEGFELTASGADVMKDSFDLTKQ